MEKTLSIVKVQGSPSAGMDYRLRGIRFAPSPTGRFHVGNLRTAWISCELARGWSQPWVVRFEDIDGPRVLEGAQKAQLADMAALGLTPDDVLVQSLAYARHWEVFERAVRERRIYPCFCSRKDVREALEGAASAPHPFLSGLANIENTGEKSSEHVSHSSFQSFTHSSAIYSGNCRRLAVQPSASEHALPSLAWRFAIEEDPSGHSDFIVARTSPTLPADRGSFAPAYHLACAIDDHDGNHHTLVRAADLAEVVPQHRAIMRWLASSEGRAYSPVAVFHTALVTQDDGHRLEKRTQGVTLSELQAAGWTPKRLIECFKKSWDETLVRAWAPGKVFGEARLSIALGDLLR